MDTSSELLPSQRMLSSGHVAAVAETFLHRIGVELFKKAAALKAIEVPNEWPLPPYDDDIYKAFKKMFVANGDDFHRGDVYWRSVLSYIVENDLLIDGFNNIQRPFVEMGESKADGALSRREGEDLKLMAILEAKTPGSETAHADKKVSPHLCLLLDDLIYDLIVEKLGNAFCTSFCVCGASLAHGLRRLKGHPI